MVEFRREFFREVQTDPVTSMIVKMHVDAWADGYEQALRDLAERLNPFIPEHVRDDEYGRLEPWV